jgi:3-deoxy-D-manno-octulosonic-acid transferase
LRAAYPLAEVVFVGGSIAPTGGHNVLEPAAAARCVVTGAHTFNFAEIISDFLAHDALVQLPALASAEMPAALSDVLRKLLIDGQRRRLLGDNALALVKQKRGATGRTIELLTPIFEQRSEVRGRRSESHGR